jgi:hypothetical protein
MLKITKEIDLRDYESTFSGNSTLDIVKNYDKISLLQCVLEDLYPDGLEEQELDDLLAHDRDTVLKWCGIKTEDDLNDEYEQITQDFQTEAEDFVSELGDLFDRAEEDIPMEDIMEEYDQKAKDLRDEFESAFSEVRVNRNEYNSRD